MNMREIIKVFSKMRVSTILSSSAFVLLFLSSAVLTAKNKPSNDDDQPLDKLFTIIVTATRTERKETEVSTNVAVITKEEIEKYQPVDVMDLLRHVPGLTLNGFGSYKAFFSASFRGTRPSGRGSLVMLDGFEMNVPSNPISVLNIPLNNIERIEVVKTPASVLYGPNGIGGVINVITKKPTTNFEGKASVLYGSFDRIEPSVYTGGLLDNGLMYSLNYRYIDTNGFRENSFTKSHLITPQLEYTGENVSCSIFANINDNHAGTPGGLPLREYKDRPERSSHKHSDIEFLFLQLGVKLEWFIDDNSQVLMKTSCRNQDDTSIEDFGFVADYKRLNTWTAELNYKSNIDLFGMKNTLLAGFEFRNLHEGVELFPDDFWSQYFFEIVTKFNIHENIWGFYIQDEIRPIANLLINIGIRYDIISTDYRDRVNPLNSFDKTLYKLSPRIGFSYSISPSLNVFGNYTEGIRSIVSSRQALELNKNLDLEEEETYELGIRGSLLGFIDYSIAGFYNITKEMVVDTNPFVIDNAGRAYSKGTELSINMNFPFGFYTNLDFTHQRAKFERFNKGSDSFAGNRVPLVPENIVGINIGWYNERFGNVNWSTRYIDDKYISSDNTSKIDDYTIVDLKYSKSFQSSELSLSVNNLFDEEYAELGLTGGSLYASGPFVHPGDGRALFVSIKYKW